MLVLGGSDFGMALAGLTISQDFPQGKVRNMLNELYKRLHLQGAAHWHLVRKKLVLLNQVA